MTEYTRTSRCGNTYKTVTFDNDHVAIVRNQKHEPDKFFLVVGMWTKEEAIKKINFFCK